MFDPCVIVFNSSMVPVRHIISLQSSYDAESFKSWYYTQYHELKDDQFVYCETREKRDELLAQLKNAQVYRITAPVWCEVELPDGAVEDMHAVRLRKVTDRIASMFEKAVTKYLLLASEIGHDEVIRHLVHLAPAIIAGPTGEPWLEITVWLDQEDLPERQWNKLLTQMSHCLLEGWGKKVTSYDAIAYDDNTLWLHFGEIGEENVRFTVDEL